jgi:hypothetical protein
MMDQLRHEEYMKQMELAEQAAKEAYGNVDMVNSPPHYNASGIECIDALRAALGEGFEFYLQGNVMKYLWRYRYKNGTQDLEKAAWYLNVLTTEVEGLYDDKS